MKHRTYDSIIIGAGFSGLLYGALLSKYGKRVLIIEKNNFIGGRAATRKACEWDWNKSKQMVSYGPHIFPAKGFAEYSLDLLGLKKKLKFTKLELPKFFMDGVVESPLSFSITEFLKSYKKLSSKLSLPEILGLAKIFSIAYINSPDQLIMKYEKISCKQLLRKLDLKSKEIEKTIRGIIGGYCFNDNLSTCPAFDLLINIKLFLKGVKEANTIMYHVNGGSGRLLAPLKEFIENKGGKILLNSEVKKLVVDGGEIKGVITKNKKSYSNHVVFTGMQTQLKKILSASKLNSSFLNVYSNISSARVIDLIVSAKRRIHSEKTSWISLLKFGKFNFGYVIIDENPNAKREHIYHICFISHNKQIITKEVLKSIKKDIEKRFEFNFSRDVKWSKAVEMIGYGAERTIKLPYSKRVGPTTPHKNLYCIGDSFKCQTVGIDGCSFSALKLSEKILNKSKEYYAGNWY